MLSGHPFLMTLANVCSSVSLLVSARSLSNIASRMLLLVTGVSVVSTHWIAALDSVSAMRSELPFAHVNEKSYRLLLIINLWSLLGALVSPSVCHSYISDF